MLLVISSITLSSAASLTLTTNRESSIVGCGRLVESVAHVGTVKKADRRHIIKQTAVLNLFN